MTKHGARELRRMLPKVHAVVCAHIKGEYDANRALGSRTAVMAGEGYAAGYRDALNDVEAVLQHGYPSDQWGFWKKARPDDTH